MTPEQKRDLRQFRDDCEDADDKKLLRATVDYIFKLEQAVDEARTMARAIIAMTDKRGVGQ